MAWVDRDDAECRSFSRMLPSLFGGGGFVVVAGLAFLHFGVFDRGGSASDHGVATVVGIVMVLAGAALIAVRRGCIIDWQAGKVTTWWGVVVPFTRVTYDIGDFDAVTVTRRVRCGPAHSIFYRATLRTHGGGEFVFAEEADASAALRIAERVVAAGGPALVDRTAEG